MPFNSNPQNIMQQIQAIMPQFCDKCGSKYHSDDVEIVSSNSSRVACKISCKNCGNNYMLQVNSPAEGVLAAKRAEFKSEMSPNEMNKFSNANTIESDEIIDVHDQIKNVQTINQLKDLIK